MDASELMRIVHAENLEEPVLYGVGDLRGEVVVLERDAAAWKAYVANERGGSIDSTFRTFESESDALEYVLLKLRQGTKYHRSFEGLSS